jgi:HSP20 family protein
MSDQRVSAFGDLHRSVDDMFRQFSRDFYGLDPTMMALPSATTHHPRRPARDVDDAGALSVWENPGHSMRMDVVERDDHYAVHVDLPGVPKEEVKISLEGEVLTIAAQRTEVRNEEHENYHLKERKYGKMSRSIRLPKDANFDNVEAKFNNGELEINIPRVTKKSEKIKTIDIQ